MGERHRAVLLPVPDGHRHIDVGQLEAPRRHEREVVVAPAVGAVPRALTRARQVVVADAGAPRVDVDGREDAADLVEQLVGRGLGAVDPAEQGLQLVATGGRGRELGDVALAHAVGPPGPKASYGATPPTEPAARQRSGRSAAQASACGPPPDQPRVRKLSTPRLSSTAAVSPRRRPRAGPAAVTTRRTRVWRRRPCADPRSAAASASPGGSSAAPGVPWWKTRTSPASGPVTRTSRSRPSGVRTVRVVSPVGPRAPGSG